MSQAQQRTGQKKTRKTVSPGKEHSVEFMFDQFDDFKSAGIKQIQQLTKRVEEISIMCDRITRFLDAFEEYSYQYNVLNRWLSALGGRECCCIWYWYRPSGSFLRTAYNRPNAWICKFVRRISKERSWLKEMKRRTKRQQNWISR